MAKGKLKIILIISILAILVASFSIGAALFFMKAHSHSAAIDPDVSGGNTSISGYTIPNYSSFSYYDFGNGPVDASDEGYYNNTYFRISSYAGLLNFSASVNNASSPECDFEDKIVYLAWDIKGSGDSSFHPIGSKGGTLINPRLGESHIFRGTFDGQGHTIRNLEINYAENYKHLSSESSVTSNQVDLAFFMAIENATIQHLRISNFLMETPNTRLDNINSYTDAYHLRCAGFAVDMRNSTIQHCAIDDLMVDNYSYNQGSYSSSITAVKTQVCGIAHNATDDSQIKDCYVNSVGVALRQYTSAYTPYESYQGNQQISLNAFYAESSNNTNLLQTCVMEGYFRILKDAYTGDLSSPPFNNQVTEITKSVFANVLELTLYDRLEHYMDESADAFTISSNNGRCFRPYQAHYTTERDGGTYYYADDGSTSLTNFNYSTSLNSSSTWYRDPSMEAYSTPKLRAFLAKGKIKFISADDHLAITSSSDIDKTDTNAITINALEDYTLDLDLTKNPLTVFGATVKAEAVTGYAFDYWEETSETGYFKVYRAVAKESAAVVEFDVKNLGYIWYDIEVDGSMSLNETKSNRLKFAPSTIEIDGNVVDSIDEFMLSASDQITISTNAGARSTCYRVVIYISGNIPNTDQSTILSIVFDIPLDQKVKGLMDENVTNRDDDNIVIVKYQPKGIYEVVEIARAVYAHDLTLTVNATRGGNLNKILGSNYLTGGSLLDETFIYVVNSGDVLSWEFSEDRTMVEYLINGSVICVSKVDDEFAYYLEYVCHCPEGLGGDILKEDGEVELTSFLSITSVAYPLNTLTFRAIENNNEKRQISLYAVNADGTQGAKVSAISTEINSGDGVKSKDFGFKVKYNSKLKLVPWSDTEANSEITYFLDYPLYFETTNYSGEYYFKITYTAPTAYYYAEHGMKDMKDYEYFDYRTHDCSGIVDQNFLIEPELKVAPKIILDIKAEYLGEDDQTVVKTPTIIYYSSDCNYNILPTDSGPSSVTSITVIGNGWSSISIVGFENNILILQLDAYFEYGDGSVGAATYYYKLAAESKYEPTADTLDLYDEFVINTEEDAIVTIQFMLKDYDGNYSGEK